MGALRVIASYLMLGPVVGNVILIRQMYLCFAALGDAGPAKDAALARAISIALWSSIGGAALFAIAFAVHWWVSWKTDHRSKKLWGYLFWLSVLTIVLGGGFGPFLGLVAIPCLLFAGPFRRMKEFAGEAGGLVGVLGTSTSAGTVDPEALCVLIDKADRLVVRREPVADSEVLFRSSDRGDFDSLRDCLCIAVPQEYFHCMCTGAPAIYFYVDNVEVAHITNHHGLSVRCSFWESDAQILDTEKWLSWFDARGIHEPRKEVVEMREQEAEHGRAWRRWTAAMPKCMQNVWDGCVDPMGMVDIEPLAKALAEAGIVRDQQIRELLEWFGSGQGPWSGFPAYESAAEDLLLCYDPSEILAAVGDGVSDAQIEGLARFFAGWGFSQKHPEGLEKVPRQLKTTLWNHANDTDDSDKRSRAKQAFK